MEIRVVSFTRITGFPGNRSDSNDVGSNRSHSKNKHGLGSSAAYQILSSSSKMRNSFLLSFFFG